MSARDEEEPVIRGSGDFLADQGIEDPAEFRVKCHLCHEIATIAEKRGLAPTALQCSPARPSRTSSVY